MSFFDGNQDLTHTVTTKICYLPELLKALNFLMTLSILFLPQGRV